MKFKSFVYGANISKKINLLDKKLDLLVAGRKIDQFSKLETNYNIYIELLYSPINNEGISTLKDLHHELIQLRSTWYHEINLELSNIEDPHNVNKLKKLFSKEKTRDNKVIHDICDLETRIRLIHFSLCYDFKLCQLIGNTDAFIHTLLPGENKKLDDIKFTLQKKANYIKEKSGNDSVNSVIENLQYISEYSSSFLPLEIPVELEVNNS